MPTTTTTKKTENKVRSHSFRNNWCGKYEGNDATSVLYARLKIVCACVCKRARALHTLHNAQAHDNKHSDWEKKTVAVAANTKIHGINWTDTMNGSREPRSFRSKMVKRVEKKTHKHTHTIYVYNIHFYLLLNLLFFCWIFYKYNVVVFFRFSTNFPLLLRLRLFVCLFSYYIHAKFLVFILIFGI